jgi:hypothetical protein
MSKFMGSSTVFTALNDLKADDEGEGPSAKSNICERTPYEHENSPMRAFSFVRNMDTASACCSEERFFVLAGWSMTAGQEK